MTEIEEARPEQKPRSLLTSRVTPGVLLLVLAGIAFFRLWIVETAYVEGSSMADTLEQGDHVLVLKFLDIDRFNIVVFRDPDGHGVSVKRVVGLAGDTISMVPQLKRVQGEEIPIGSQLYLNGQKVEEPYAASLIPSSLPPTKIPEGSYFVLGDNRDDSIDSRRYGPLKAERIVGVGVAVVYPFGRVHFLESPDVTIDVGKSGPPH